MHTLTERHRRALAMRREGKMLREIGEALHVSTGRARAIVERALMIERQAGDWARGLPARYVRLLTARGISSLGGLRKAVETGALERMPGVGEKSYAAICEWLNGNSPAGQVVTELPLASRCDGNDGA